MCKACPPIFLTVLKPVVTFGGEIVPARPSGRVSTKEFVMRAFFAPKLVARLSVAILLGAGACVAQEATVASQQPAGPPDHPWTSSVYCSGFYTSERVSDDLRLVTGEQSNYKIAFVYGDIVYLSKGSSQGVKEGDRFSVVRQESDPLRVQWFKWQDKLSNAMGSHYSDLGQLTVIKTEPNIAIAKVSLSCAFMQRGDIVLPYSERPAGPFKDPSTFDILAPSSGKPKAMIVQGKNTAQMSGQWNTVYVNLGTKQGVKVGDYFRVFRYQGTRGETIPQQRDYQDRMYGFGSNPKHYEWNDLPREILGEGIVLNVSQNASSVLLTTSRSEIMAGDYVELE
jgi:hypothetical protein